MSQQNPKENFDQLIRDGYCLVEEVLDDDMLLSSAPKSPTNSSTPKAKKSAPNSAPPAA